MENSHAEFSAYRLYSRCFVYILAGFILFILSIIRVNPPALLKTLSYVEGSEVEGYNLWLTISHKSLFFSAKSTPSPASAKTTLSFSKWSKPVRFLSIFAKNGPLFAKNVPKIAKSAPKTLHFGARALLRRCF
ncbi:MAG: hypothetical protein IID32_07305 [Planctomycetes bacterium]|nr:hypothetical protein [Planctomycetota bacterium]